MTWHADQTKDRPAEAEREKLLLKRSAIEDQIRALKLLPVGKSQAAMQGRLEDLTALAKKITSIDKKLGRIST